MNCKRSVLQGDVQMRAIFGSGLKAGFERKRGPSRLSGGITPSSWAGPVFFRVHLFRQPDNPFGLRALRPRLWTGLPLSPASINFPTQRTPFGYPRQQAGSPLRV